MSLTCLAVQSQKQYYRELLLLLLLKCCSARQLQALLPGSVMNTYTRRYRALQLDWRLATSAMRGGIAKLSLALPGLA
jgi:hypothetical protein